MKAYHLYIYACLVSLLTASVVIVSYVIFTRTTPWRKSQFLMWAFRLVCVNALFSFVALVWNFLSIHRSSGAQADYACRIFLPFPIFFFLCGYGCNIFIAFRFNDPGALRRISKTPIYIVWVTCFLMVTPIVILNSRKEYAISEVYDYDSSLSDQGNFCMFSTHNIRAKIVNNLCFQVPLILTLVINLWAYLKGLHALKDAPQSVIAREMRRAGVYMSVLLVVWIPNFIVNILTELYPNSEFNIAIEVIVMLTALQGFFNSVVFIWGYPKYRKWLKNKLISLFCFCFLEPHDRFERLPGLSNNGVDNTVGKGSAFKEQIAPLLVPLIPEEDSSQPSILSNGSSNESCDIQLRRDIKAVTHLRSSITKNDSYSTLNGLVHSGGSSQYEDLERKMSTLDKIVRFSGIDYCYYKHDDPSVYIATPPLDGSISHSQSDSISCLIQQAISGQSSPDDAVAQSPLVSSSVYEPIVNRLDRGESIDVRVDEEVVAEETTNRTSFTSTIGCDYIGMDPMDLHDSKKRCAAIDGLDLEYGIGWADEKDSNEGVKSSLLTLNEDETTGIEAIDDLPAVHAPLLVTLSKGSVHPILKNPSKTPHLQFFNSFDDDEESALLHLGVSPVKSQKKKKLLAEVIKSGKFEEETVKYNTVKNSHHRHLHAYEQKFEKGNSNITTGGEVESEDPIAKERNQTDTLSVSGGMKRSASADDVKARIGRTGGGTSVHVRMLARMF